MINWNDCRAAGESCRPCNCVEELIVIGKKLEKELAEYQWVSVEDRLPNNIRTVWILLKAHATDTLSYSEGFYCPDEKLWGIIGETLLTDVEYWMEKQSLPKKEEVSE